MKKIVSIIILFIFIFSCVRKTLLQKRDTASNIFVKTKKTPNVLDLGIISDSSTSMFLKKHPAFAKYKETFTEFYKKRSFEYAWITQEGILPSIDLFINMINSGAYKSNLTADSVLRSYNRILDETNLKKQSDSLQNLEFNLSISFFKYADEEWAGTDEKMVKNLEWYIPRKKLKYHAILDSLLKIKENELLAFKAPISNQYFHLQAHLEKYRKIEEKANWLPMVFNKKMYEIGDSSQIISQIKKKLLLTEDLTKADTTSIFDSVLVLAVQLFQKRHGLKPDGKITDKFIKEMNVPIRQRIEQIIINMERAKWIPFDLKGEYLVVNIPEFKLHGFDGNQKLWEMNVVVGKATNKTVIFNGNLQYIVLNPYWVVTNHIFTKEILPRLRKNPSYLAEQNMELVKASEPTVLINPLSIDWSQKADNYHHFVARQKPGRNNSLGKVKFIFPNQYSIYLHDTPAKTLFSSNSRSFSHGCIRVEKPTFLTKFLLKDQPQWTDKTLEKIWDTSSKEYYIPLKRKVPVFIGYFTAWVDTEGRLNFRNDIYGHDSNMSKLLFDKIVD
jgi:L,D-transpeptidase YcbB